MDKNRKTALMVGVLYIIGTAAGFFSVIVIGPLMDDPLVQFSAHRNQVVIGALSVIVMALALALVPVLLFPIFKKYNETLAVGYVVFRGGLESFGALLTPLCWLTLLAISQATIQVGASAASQFQPLSAMLLAAAESSSQVMSMVFSLGALMIYYLLFQTKLIPRWISVWGLVAAALYFAEPLFALFGKEMEFLFFPMALQEMVMAVWMIVKGFDPSAIAAGSAVKKLNNRIIPVRL
jgi:hypothetical protein